MILGLPQVILRHLHSPASRKEGKQLQSSLGVMNSREGQKQRFPFVGLVKTGIQCWRHSVVLGRSQCTHCHSPRISCSRNPLGICSQHFSGSHQEFLGQETKLVVPQFSSCKMVLWVQLGLIPVQSWNSRKGKCSLTTLTSYKRLFLTKI